MVFVKKPAINWWVYGWLFDCFSKKIESGRYVEEPGL
jgi:hypothetical protein